MLFIILLCEKLKVIIQHTDLKLLIHSHSISQPTLPYNISQLWKLSCNGQMHPIQHGASIIDYITQKPKLVNKQLF